MIAKVSGWERSYKTGLAAYLATHPEELNTSYEVYNIKQGFGNLHLFKTPYPWHYRTSAGLIKELERMPRDRVTDTLYLIDEVDDVFPARDYNVAEQKQVIRKLSQHGKLGNIILHTYQEGDPDDPLLGPDRILRSLTRVRITIDYFSRENWYLIYRLKDLRRKSPERKLIMKNLDRYLDYWDTTEPVI